MINLDGKKVTKMLVGSNVIYQDSDGWIPLELPDGVTGQVFFKDNSDGTAGLIGNCIFKDTPNTLILNPPSGYVFSGINWRSSGSSDYRYVHVSELGGTSNRDVYLPMVSEGSLYFEGDSKSSPYVGDKHLFNFCAGFTRNLSPETTIDASPALINIEKV